MVNKKNVLFLSGAKGVQALYWHKTTNMHIHKRREREASPSPFFRNSSTYLYSWNVGCIHFCIVRCFLAATSEAIRGQCFESVRQQGSLLGGSLEFYYLSEPQEHMHATQQRRERNKNAA